MMPEVIGLIMATDEEGVTALLILDNGVVVERTLLWDQIVAFEQLTLAQLRREVAPLN